MVWLFSCDKQPSWTFFLQMLSRVTSPQVLENVPSTLIFHMWNICFLSYVLIFLNISVNIFCVVLSPFFYDGSSVSRDGNERKLSSKIFNLPYFLLFWTLWNNRKRAPPKSSHYYWAKVFSIGLQRWRKLKGLNPWAHTGHAGSLSETGPWHLLPGCSCDRLCCEDHLAPDHLGGWVGESVGFEPAVYIWVKLPNEMLNWALKGSAATSDFKLQRASRILEFQNMKL